MAKCSTRPLPILTARRSQRRRSPVRWSVPGASGPASASSSRTGSTNADLAQAARDGARQGAGRRRRVAVRRSRPARPGLECSAALGPDVLRAAAPDPPRSGRAGCRCSSGWPSPRRCGGRRGGRPAQMAERPADRGAQAGRGARRAGGQRGDRGRRAQRDLRAEELPVETAHLAGHRERRLRRPRPARSGPCCGRSRPTTATGRRRTATPTRAACGPPTSRSARRSAARSGWSCRASGCSPGWPPASTRPVACWSTSKGEDHALSAGDVVHVAPHGS